MSSVSCLSCVANHSLDSELLPFTPVLLLGGVALLREARRTGPLTAEVTLGGTADLALSVDLESIGGVREGDEDETRLGGWGVLVMVVAIIYCRRNMVVSFRDDGAFSLG